MKIYLKCVNARLGIFFQVAVFLAQKFEPTKPKKKNSVLPPPPPPKKKIIRTKKKMSQPHSSIGEENICILVQRCE